MAHCYMCKTTNPALFHKDSGRKAKVCSRCIECDKKYKGSHGERVSNVNPKCHVCRQRLRPHDFYRDKTRYNGLSSKCKSCAAKRLRGRKFIGGGGVR